MARKKAKALPPKMIAVYAEILQETEDAILVRCDEDADGAWLPKSQIKYDGERGDTGVEIEIPEFMAEEKGFCDGMGLGKAQPPASAPAPEQEPPAAESGPEPLPEPEPEPAFTKRAFGDNVKWLKEESITISVPLSESEKARYAEEMAALDKEIEELEDERSEVSSRLKKQIDAKEQERREMSAHVNDGEQRIISCDCLKDYNSGEMVWTEAYPPYDEVQRRKMTKEEQQPTLLEFEGKPINETSPPIADGIEGMDFDTLADVPPEPETVTLSGTVVCINYADEAEIDFDEAAGTYLLPLGAFTSFEEDGQTFFTIPLALAIEEGIIEAPGTADAGEADATAGEEASADEPGTEPQAAA
jgi:hypothetical protein